MLINFSEEDVRNEELDEMTVELCRRLRLPFKKGDDLISACYRIQDAIKLYGYSSRDDLLDRWLIRISCKFATPERFVFNKIELDLNGE